MVAVGGRGDGEGDVLWRVASGRSQHPDKARAKNQTQGTAIPRRWCFPDIMNLESTAYLAESLGVHLDPQLVYLQAPATTPHTPSEHTPGAEHSIEFSQASPSPFSRLHLLPSQKPPAQTSPWAVALHPPPSSTFL